MMKNTSNFETKQDILSDIREVKAKCIETYNAVVNSPLYACWPSNNIQAQSLAYFEALRTEISGSTTNVPTNTNYITSEFLVEMKERTDQLNELIAYTRGCIHDVDKDIERFKNLIKMAKKALLVSQLDTQNESPEQIKKAKEAFKVLKRNLHDLIQTMFSNDYELVTHILGQLTQENSSEGSEGYLQITPETYRIIQILRDSKIVTTNPYNDMEIKLAL